MGRVRALGFVALLLAASPLVGCAARASRLGVDPSTTSRARGYARPGESGYASFGSAIRLRTDTPSLTALQDEARLREIEAYAAAGWDQPVAGPVGAEEEAGWVQPGAGTWNGAGPMPCAPIGPAAPVFGRPGGWVPPGLRAPSPVTTPFHRAFPTADVTYHRPGLSTGTGIYGRDAMDASRGGR